MTLTHFLPTIAFVAAAACLPHTQALAPFASADSGTGAVETDQLTGFVELYPDEGVKLLSGGREILLSGATDHAVSLGGLEVVAVGRFDGEVFRVDSVARVPSEVIAVTSTTDRCAFGRGGERSPSTSCPKNPVSAQAGAGFLPR